MWAQIPQNVYPSAPGPAFGHGAQTCLLAPLKPKTRSNPHTLLYVDKNKIICGLDALQGSIFFIKRVLTVLRYPVLFASDVAARGIDIQDINLIVHCGIPRSIIYLFFLLLIIKKNKC